MGKAADRACQLSVLGLLLYLLAFPMVSPLIRAVAPDVMHCYYKENTGKECPFCGTTTATRNFILHGKPLPTKIVVGAIAVFEEVIRKIVMLVVLCRRKNGFTPLQRACDFGITVGLFLLCSSVFVLDWAS